jgi:hypothetical protein
MKTILISILLTLLIVTNSEPVKTNNNVDIDAILAKSEKNLTKATTVTKVADQQQKAKMTEMHQTMDKLVEEKKQLEQTLIETKNELQTVKEVINNNAADTGEHFNLFPEN